MNSDDIQLIAFEIILHSGNSRTMIHEAFAAMRVGDFDKADERLKASNDELLLAHQSQSDKEICRWHKDRDGDHFSSCPGSLDDHDDITRSCVGNGASLS